MTISGMLPFRTALRGLLALACALPLLGPASAQTRPPERAPLALMPQPRMDQADSLEGNYLAALIAGASRDTRAAAHFYREALQADPRNGELLERAFVSFLADGAMPDAFRAAEALVKEEPENGLAHLALATRAIRNKQFATARRHLERGGSRADITSALLTGWAWLGSGNAPRALRTLDRLDGEPAYVLFRDYHAALVATVAGDRTEAEKRFKSVYASDQTTLRIIDVYGRFEASRGQRESALALYEAYDRILPRQPIVRDALERLRDKRPLPLAVADVQQGAAEVFFGLGSIGSRQEDGIFSLIYLRLALYLEPRHAMALVTLGDVLERTRQTERAIEIYRQVPEDSPLRRSVDIQIGIAYEILERTEESVRHLEGLIEANPKDIDALTALGNVYRNRKRFDDAAEAYDRAIKAAGEPRPEYWNLYYSRGIAYERTKRWTLAEADFKKALELVPNNLTRDRALVLNYLGYSWVDQGMNIDEAFRMLTRAVELSPRDGHIIDSLGWAYYRLGRYDDAVRELERAVEIMPADPVINDHLGDAYWKVGRRLEAQFQWAHARDSKPEPDSLASILIKIEHGLGEDGNPAMPEAAPASLGTEKPAATERPATTGNGG